MRPCMKLSTKVVMHNYVFMFTRDVVSHRYMYLNLNKTKETLSGFLKYLK